MTPEKYQLLPDLPPEQFEALKTDIAERGVVVPVLVDEFGAIIDGHNRAKACRELGINDYPVEVRSGLSEEEKRALARKLNALRRHLSREQVRALIADQVRETPDWSNNRIAAGLGVDDKTVAAVRAGLESTSEIPKLEKLVGADGKARTVRQRGERRQQARDRTAGDDTDDDIDAAWDKFCGGPAKRAKLEHALDLIRLGEDPNSEKVVKLLCEGAVCVVGTPNYDDPFKGRTDDERREWHVFMLFLVRHCRWRPEGAGAHTEWLLGRFQSAAEWMGEEGDKFCKTWGMRTMGPKIKEAWSRFAAKHASRTLDDLTAELEKRAA